MFLSPHPEAPSCREANQDPVDVEGDTTFLVITAMIGRVKGAHLVDVEGDGGAGGAVVVDAHDGVSPAIQQPILNRTDHLITQPKGAQPKAARAQSQSSPYSIGPSAQST